MSNDAPSPRPRPRPAIANIPAYVPGKPPAARPGLTTWKLSSNENPFPPPPAVVRAVADAAASMNRYPDMGCTTLYAALARRLAVEPQQLAAGTGSVAVLYHLLQAFCDPGDEVVHAWRSFEAYPIAVAVTGAVSVQVPLTHDARHDLDAMAAAVTDRTRVVIVCTPNNPTGPSVTHHQLEEFVARIPGDVLVVVDEAYREFVRADDPADPMRLLPRHPNVVVMRTFAKAYGLAGLRVGFLVADQQIATAVRACALPFGVSSVAQAAALACLDDEATLLNRVDEIVGERERVVAALREQGWDVPDAQGNFVWFGVGDRAADFAESADQAGIVVRPFAGDGVRVSIGERPANDVLLDVAKRFLAED
ncbi:MAG TPA: histidinol-phosphate transaminase [Marmoricola sp.]|nr:histidinol-phosphate transaminase [Marmoricola sp.]